MAEYKLVGYNSGGYRSSRKISFDGKIEKRWKPDPEYSGTDRTISYFKIIFPDCTVTEEDNEFLQNILNTQSYIESFLITEVIELPKTVEIKGSSEDEDISSSIEPKGWILWNCFVDFIKGK